MPKDRAHDSSGRARRARRWWSYAALFLMVAFLLDAAWVGTTALREADRIRAYLTEGAMLLEQGQIEEASTRFALASHAAASLSGALGHPAALLAGHTPGLAEDMNAARALAEASSELARAGTSLTRAAERAGWDGTTLPGMASPGRLDVTALTEATPALRDAADAAARARDLLEGVDTNGTAGSIAAAVAEARSEVSLRAPSLERAAMTAELLPAFLGADGPRRYLLIAQNLSDPRGSGGFVGSHAVLTADGGRLDLGPMVATAELGRGPTVESPDDLVARYDRFGTLNHLMATTYPPDFRTGARLLVDEWAARGEEPVDGVISVDAVFMAYMLEAIGPVETATWPEALTSANAIDVLGRATFDVDSGETSNALQVGIAEAVWQAALERVPQAHPLADAFSRASAERHLQIYSVHPEEQALLEALGVAGAVPETARPLQVTWFGGSDTRAGYFADKEVVYRAALSPDGWADVQMSATLHNGAPSEGTPSVLLGGSPGSPFGWFHAFVNVYLPADAHVMGVRGGSLALEEEEGGKPVVMGLLGAGPGKSASFHVRYRTQATDPLEDGSLRMQLDVLPQPALRPDLIRIEIQLPPGAEIIAVSPGVTVEAGVARWEGRPVTPDQIWIEFR